MVEAVSNEEQLNLITQMESLLASPQNPESDKESEKTSVSNEKSSSCCGNTEDNFSDKAMAHQKFSETLAIENHVNSSSNIEPFFVADMRRVRSQYAKWTRCLPRFTPFYAVKCNNDAAILRTLFSMGSSFDCASMEEIKTVLNMGVSPNDIIYANPCKSPIHLKYAASVGVKKMTFDNADELIKIKQYCPSAELVIRIQVDDSKSICAFGVKFGVRLGNTKPLLALAAKLNLNIIGVSFHVGSGCTDASAYNDAIKRARAVFDEAKDFGFCFNFLDIGGGFPGNNVAQNGAKIEFEEIASVVNKSIEEYFPDYKDLTLIGEPGRFFGLTSFTLITNITSRRTIEHQEGMSFMYYINDGVYGSFNSLIFDHADVPQPHFLVKNSQGIYNHVHAEDFNEFHTCSVWGPTCDSMDCISKSIKLPQLNVGDWLIFDNMGAYTHVAASCFNGMDKPRVFYLETENDTPVLKPTYITPYEPNQKASLVEEDFVLS
jgi:ornithine decarboxylase